MDDIGEEDGPYLTNYDAQERIAEFVGDSMLATEHPTFVPGGAPTAASGLSFLTVDKCPAPSLTLLCE